MILNIQKDGLVWGESIFVDFLFKILVGKRQEICFGIEKLVISAEIEDDKVCDVFIEIYLFRFLLMILRRKFATLRIMFNLWMLYPSKRFEILVH